MKGRMLIAFFIVVCMLSMIPYSSVKAISITHSASFEGTVLGSWYHDSNITTNRTSSLATTKVDITTTCKYGTRGLEYYGNGGNVKGFMNFTYSLSQFMTNFSSWFIYSGDNNPANIMYMTFYNSTLQHSYVMGSPTTRGIIIIKLERSTGNMIVNGVTVTKAFAIWQSFYWKITNDLGDMEWGFNTTKGGATTYNNATLINSGARIDRCYIQSASQITTNQLYFDNVLYVESPSYTVGGTGGGCIDVSDMDYYSKNIEVFDSYLDISSPFIEFTSHSSLSLTPEVFELWVGSALYDGDSDTSNYFLYINGIPCGNPECFYLLSGQTYVLQWDLSSISPISEEVLTFELAHSITFDGTHYWNIARATANLMYGAPSPTMITYTNTGTNGVLDGNPIYSGSCWKLYFSAFGTPENEENTEFDVGINLIGFNTHPTYNTPYSYIYETIYFEVFSNRTDNYYHLNISKGATTQGNEQGYPKDIYSYHIIHGFTPITNGNYTVSLCKDSNNAIVDHKHFNITTKTTDYAIWTFPNPSFGGVNHGVTVYISDDTIFQNYYVSGVVDEDNVNIFNLSNRKILVGTLDGNKYWSTSLLTFAVSGWEYWRLWGTNDNVSFIPLTSPYVHYVNSIAQYNYIRTSLTNGEGYTGESFNVYGQHSYILSQLSVYLDNKPIKDVSKNVSFLIPYSFSNVGTHTFSLRVFNDGEWEIVDSVVVSITIKPSEKGELGTFLPPPYSYIMGAILTIVLMILPTIALGKIGVAQGETLKYVPIFSGTVGFILSCLIGFFPWYSIFALLFVLILIITVLYLSKKKE